VVITPVDRAKSWFSTSPGEELNQGDLLLDLDFEAGSARTTIDALVLSQSCDLERREGAFPNISVLLAPCYSLPIWLALNPTQLGSLEAIRAGRAFDFYLLPPCSTVQEERLLSSRVVDFRQLFARSFQAIWDHAHGGHRPFSLNSPYREHFGSAVARYFSRVGLPIDIAPCSYTAAEKLPDSNVSVGEAVGRGTVVLARDTVIVLERMENAPAGDTFVRARVQGHDQNTAIGCGRTPEDAAVSLWLNLEAHYGDLVAGRLAKPDPWRWLSELFRPRESS
jgi:hypothetical protein